MRDVWILLINFINLMKYKPQMHMLRLFYVREFVLSDFISFREGFVQNARKTWVLHVLKPKRERFFVKVGETCL